MTKKHIPKLTVEVIKDRANLGYLSLIEYKRENYLGIIDNITDDEITAYVLDYAEQEDINVKDLLSLMTIWFYKGSDAYPFSFEIAKNGFTKTLAPIHKTFDINFVSRIVGNPFKFCLDKKAKIRRRRVVQLPAGIEITLKKPI